MYVYKISSGIYLGKNFGNQFTFAKVMIKSQVTCFFETHRNKVNCSLVSIMRCKLEKESKQPRLSNL